jgi:hypothetical protein
MAVNAPNRLCKRYSSRAVKLTLTNTSTNTKIDYFRDRNPLTSLKHHKKTKLNDTSNPAAIETKDYRMLGRWELSEYDIILVIANGALA